jgi:hypothetical protein
MSSSNEVPEFYQTEHGNSTNQKLIPLNHEAWLAEQWDSNNWIGMAANPSWIYFSEDMFSAELPFQKHIYLCKLHIKNRGNTPAYSSITVGKGIITKPPKGNEMKIWIVSQIQVSFGCFENFSRELVHESRLFSRLANQFATTYKFLDFL